MKEMPARIFDVQRFSVHDGPGIRTTIFFKGCPLSCAWCQNPESISPSPQLMIYPELCIECGTCVRVCPDISEKEEGAQLSNKNLPSPCSLCGKCIEVCPAMACRIAGYETTITDIATIALRDKPFYGKEGGVTLGGGEPLAQWECVKALSERLHEEGIHVALDTAAVAPDEIVKAVPDYIDLVIADVKMIDPQKHMKWTGMENTRILETIRYWSRAMPGRLWITALLVPGVHDANDIDEMGKFIQSLTPTPPVRILPYHAFGNSKYIALGLDEPAFRTGSERLVKKAKALFKNYEIPILEMNT